MAMAGSPHSAPGSPAASSFLRVPQEPSSNGMEQARLQLLWDQSVSQSTKFVRYKYVRVLLLSWAENHDDLETGPEVKALAKVFEEDYNFKVHKETLDPSRSRAQSQVNLHISKFVEECERLEREDSTLMIVYYAGHGWSDMTTGPRQLKLAGKTNQKAQAQLERNCVLWEGAESNIRGAEVDVFLIFDCCSAGMICRSGELRRFQALAACSSDAKTAPPGRQSFTSALIWALKKLSKEKEKPYFDSAQLRYWITRYPEFPENQVPVLTDRLWPCGNISIAPLKANDTPLEIPDNQTEDPNCPARASYLDLRFHCSSLENEDIELIAQNLQSLLRTDSIPVDRVDFLGKNTVWKSVQWEFAAKIGHLWKARALRNASTLRKRGISQDNKVYSDHKQTPPVSPLPTDFSGIDDETSEKEGLDAQWTSSQSAPQCGATRLAKRKIRHEGQNNCHKRPRRKCKN